MIILVMLTMLAFDSLAQGDNVLVSIVQSNLVYHSLDDNQVKTIPLSSTILENEVVRSIDYNPDDCIFFVITSFRATPKLYSVTLSGLVSKIGDITASNGASIYSCEAITYNEVTKKLYASISFPSRDVYTETLAELSTTNAVATIVSTINTSSPSLDDMDFMESYGNKIIIADGNPSPNPFFYIFSIDLDNLSATPIVVYSENNSSSPQIQELAVMGNTLYVELQSSLFKLDLSSSNSKLELVGPMMYLGSNSPLQALTNFNHAEIFNPVPLPKDTTICEGDSLFLDVSGFQQFYWNNSATGSFYAKNSGSYYGQAQIGECLFDSDTFNLSLESCRNYCDSLEETLPLLLGNYSDTTLCKGDTFQIQLDIDADSIVWSNGQKGKEVIVFDKTLVFASIHIDTCTFETSTISVDFEFCDKCQELREQIESLLEFPDEEIKLCLYDKYEVNFSAQSFDSIKWNDGDTSFFRELTDSRTYNAIIYIDTCIFITETLRLNFVNCDGCFVEFPNAFTPNQDNLNEIFQPVISDDCNILFTDFSVYNKWGEKLLNSKLPAWDGFYLDQISEAGVYFYTCSYTNLLTQKSEVLKGVIHLEY